MARILVIDDDAQVLAMHRTKPMLNFSQILKRILLGDTLW